MTRIWPIALGIFCLMLPVTAMVPLLHELTEGRYPGLSELNRHLFMSAHIAGALVFAVIAGLLSDRLGQRTRLIVPALLVNGLFLAALGFAPPGWILPVMALGGVVAALMFAPSLVLVSRIAGPSQRGSAW